jgi:hypothetical protein
MSTMVSVNYIYLLIGDASRVQGKRSYISLSSSDVGNISDYSEYLRFPFPDGREAFSFYDNVRPIFFMSSIRTDPPGSPFLLYSKPSIIGGRYLSSTT